MLKSPFPFYGGKRHWAGIIWENFGNPETYIDPFFGSLAVPLWRDTPCRREIVCDHNGYLCNFFRALRSAPDEVAYWADYPSIHQDLTARHIWLKEELPRHADRLQGDPEYYDAKIAGWWVWGQSLYIGGGFCLRDDVAGRPTVETHTAGRGVNRQVADKRPLTKPNGYPSGVSRSHLAHQSIPRVNHKPGGHGVSRQRMDSRPRPGGHGISRQQVEVPLDGCDGTRLLPYFEALARRLTNMVFLNREWHAALSPTLLGDVPSRPSSAVAILFDPPYLTEGRSKKLYSSDKDGSSNQAAKDSYDWAVSFGLTYRIAYCCRSGDFDVPKGWTYEERTFSGVKDPLRRHVLDRIMFSPACGGQIDMFEQAVHYEEHREKMADGPRPEST